ncbi:MAG TPA: heavy metal translocating P-type ATPase [Bryobacteraceae bacterium]|nr:heavy metal translocating P-type ATPase [Bryobacteraceae bacterium]
MEFGSDLLAGLSIIASISTGQFLVGSIIVLMLSGGTALEAYASRQANSALAALHQRAPRIAHRKTGASWTDIGLEDIRPGDILAILSQEVAPVDGTVVEGYGRMDESYLTGEPFEISKAPGSSVISGSVNKDQILIVRASKTPDESRYAQIVRLLEATEANRPQMRRLGDKLAAWYTPVAVITALTAWLLSRDSLRFLAVTVIATPCPLLLAIPVAIVAAVSLSARHGIIVSNPAALEQIALCRTLIFDKTGTLTYGRPVLTDVVCMQGVSRGEVIGKAASLEEYSKHPLASAIRQAARNEGIPLSPANSISEEPGTGLQGVVDNVAVAITGRSRVSSTDLPLSAAGLECVVLLNGRVAALFRFRDEPRRESRPFISHLKPMHGIRRIVLLSGDRQQEVEYLAERVGISEAYSGKSPEDKVALVTAAVRQDKTLFVGDGINDAPAMLVATVGVALGSGSNVTSEAADAIVLDSSLEKTDELIHISRRMRRIALQSAIGGMTLSVVGMAFAALGKLPPISGAVAQEVIDLCAVLNALRVAYSSHRLADF